MAYLDDLIAARDAVAAELKLINLATLTGDWSNVPAGAKPNVMGGGANADHGEYYERKLKTLERLNKQIEEAPNVAGAGEVFEIYQELDT